MMLDPEDKDDLDNREYEDFPQVTSLLFDQVLHPINPGAYLPSSLLPDSRLQWGWGDPWHGDHESSLQTIL